jgi:hypothetical protein
MTPRKGQRKTSTPDLPEAPAAPTERNLRPRKVRLNYASVV